jgi:hypothetical protein
MENENKISNMLPVSIITKKRDIFNISICRNKLTKGNCQTKQRTKKYPKRKYTYNCVEEKTLDMMHNTLQLNDNRNNNINQNNDHYHHNDEILNDATTEDSQSDKSSFPNCISINKDHSRYAGCKVPAQPKSLNNLQMLIPSFLNDKKDIIMENSVSYEIERKYSNFEDKDLYLLKHTSIMKLTNNNAFDEDIFFSFDNDGI